MNNMKQYVKTFESFLFEDNSEKEGNIQTVGSGKTEIKFDSNKAIPKEKYNGDKYLMVTDINTGKHYGVIRNSKGDYSFMSDKELTDEQLAEYGEAYFYLKLFNSPKNFINFLNDCKSFIDVRNKMAKIMKDTIHISGEEFNTNRAFDTFTTIALRAIFGDNMGTGTDSKKHTYNVGYSRVITTYSRYYPVSICIFTNTKEWTNNEKKYKIGTVKAQVEADDINWSNIFQTEVYAPMEDDWDGRWVPLSSFMKELTFDEMKKLINQNVAKVLNSEEFRFIEESTKRLKKEIAEGEKQFTTQARRTVQNIFKGLGF